MRTSILKRTILPAMALALLWGCGDTVGRRLSMAHGGGPGVPVRIVLGEGSGPSRTIAPEHLDQVALGGYTLELTGSSDMGDSVNVPNFTLNNGVGMCDLSPGVWKLELVASNGGTQVLKGEGTVEVRGLPTYVSITLTPVTSGTGTVRLTVNWQAADRDFVQPSAPPYPSGLTVSIALYDPVTGQKATSYERLASGGNGAQSDTDAFFRRGFTGGSGGGGTSAVPTTFTYTGGTSSGKTYNVPAGMYMLKFTITGGNLPAGQRLEWSDNLYVEAGRETAGAITIPRLTNEPAEPASLSCRLEAARLDGVIPLAIGWGGVYNAERYELEVAEYAAGAGAHPTDDAGWQLLAGSATVYRYDALPGSPYNYTAEQRVGPVCLDGGLLSGQGQLRLGVRGAGRTFAARIRATNTFGMSGWSYAAAGVVTP